MLRRRNISPQCLPFAFRTGQRSSTMQGFTLIELILVIVILGIVSISVSGIIRSTITVVADVSERENLVREGSFVVERLSRELNSAVPNSVRIMANAATHCVEFVPIKWSTTYLSLPLTAETNTTVDLVELLDIDNNIFVPNTNDWGIVYPTQTLDVYDDDMNHRQAVISCSDDGDGSCATNDDTDGVVQISFSDGFNATSPTKRIYFAEEAISYCVRNNEIYRHTSSINVSQTLYTSGGQLMAQNLVNVLGANTSSGEQNPFQITNASSQREALTSLLLIFGREDEHVTFMQEVQIPNVP